MSASNRNLDLTGIQPLAFVPVQKIEDVLPVLRARLSMSANIFNMASMYSSYKDEVTFYTLRLRDTESIQESWVLAVYTKDEDRGVEVFISTPTPVILNDEIKNAILNWPIIDWNRSYSFGVVDYSLALMLSELNKIKSPTSSGVYSCNFYHFLHDRDRITKISEIPNAELKRISPCTGVEFFHRTWKFSKYASLTYFRNVLERNPSSGLYVKGEERLVCGMTLNGFGIMGMLYTEPEHRNKGFGKIVMQNLIREVLERKLIPCSLVEDCNPVSQAFHSTVGMEVVGRMYFIFYDA